MTEGLLRALRAARDFRPQRFLALTLGADRIGWIRGDHVERLRAWPGIFEFADKSLLLLPAPQAALSHALAEVTQALARDGSVRGWRGETYAVRAASSGEPLFHIERAAMRFFGFTSSAAHLNGFFEATKRSVIARRAPNKAIDPGMLDNLVAGGVNSGQDAWQTLLRECGEEAGIAPALARSAKPAGVLEVCREVADGLHSEVLHVHDLALPADFVPRNTDGEVSEFLSLDAAALLERIARGEMTVEAGLVSVEFMLRHRALPDPDGKIAAAVQTCRLPKAS